MLPMFSWGSIRPFDRGLTLHYSKIHGEVSPRFLIFSCVNDSNLTFNLPTGPTELHRKHDSLILLNIQLTLICIKVSETLSWCQHGVSIWLLSLGLLAIKEPFRVDRFGLGGIATGRVTLYPHNGDLQSHGLGGLSACLISNHVSPRPSQWKKRRALQVPSNEIHKHGFRQYGESRHMKGDMHVLLKGTHSEET